MVAEAFALGLQHPRHAGERRGRLGDRPAILAGDEHVDGAAEGGHRAERLGRPVLQHRVVVFGEEQHRHSTPASFLSLSIELADRGDLDAAAAAARLDRLEDA